MIVGTGKTRVQRQAELEANGDGHLELIQRAAGDPDAFARLYLQHYDDVFHYCVRRLFDRHGAEDVTSTVFFKVMQNLDSFRGEGCHFRSWLLRIATNAVNDYLRDKRKRAGIMERLSGGSRTDCVQSHFPDEEVPSKKALLQEGLLSLKPKYQTVITLHFFENMRLTEIAACLGKRPSTVRTWLSRGTAKLRRQLGVAGRRGGHSI